MSSKIGAIAIGRNEGERLGVCLRSLVGAADRVVYVDSGSTDGSREFATSLGVVVVELDLSKPFTAARARNEGFARLLELNGEVEYVQFVDGDCELRSDWIEKAKTSLDTDDRLAAVCGRRRERFPNASVYNKLTDIEWDTPVGNAQSCGGDVLFRVSAMQEAGGYDPSVIAGEEPELCFRLRQNGWRIRRLDAEMTLHDAAMDSFDQWWKRAVRAGHAAAEGAWMHGRSPERFNVRRVVRPILWAGVLPFIATAAAFWTYGISIAVLVLIYLLQRYRMYMRGRMQGKSRADARAVATFTLISQLAMLIGIVTFVFNRIRGKRTKIIEYKGDDKAGINA